MTMEGIGLFAGIKGKMDYVNKFQAITSQNISNADTPNYQPKTLKEVDFGRVLERSMQGQGAKAITMQATSSGHMAGGGRLDNPRSEEARITYEVAPAGNAVVLEEQMMQANKNTMDHALMARILNKNVSMIQKAIGNQN